MSKRASCSSPISESGQPCVQDTNPAAMPAEETDTETFLCLRPTSREKADTANLVKIVDSIERERRFSDKGNPVDQAKGHMCDRQESALSDASSFVGVGSSIFGSTGYQTECDTCDLLMESPNCEFTKKFWKSIPNVGPDKSQSCHCKFFEKLIQKMKDDFPHEKGLNSKSIINLLKFLLHVEFKDPVAPVRLSNLLRLVKLFGPVRKENNNCVLLTQLHHLLRRSLKKREKDSNKMSTWFVGEISRQEADDLLLNDNCKDKTFLIRISGTDGEDGDFALSVRHENHCHHLKIQLSMNVAVGAHAFEDRNDEAWVRLVDANANAGVQYNEYGAGGEAGADAYVFKFRDQQTAVKAFGVEISAKAGTDIQAFVREGIILGAEIKARGTLVESKTGAVHFRVGLGISSGAKVEDGTIETKFAGCGLHLGKRIGISVLDNEISFETLTIFGKGWLW